MVVSIPLADPPGVVLSSMNLSGRDEEAESEREGRMGRGRADGGGGDGDETTKHGGEEEDTEEGGGGAGAAGRGEKA